MSAGRPRWARWAHPRWIPLVAGVLGAVVFASIGAFILWKAFHPQGEGQILAADAATVAEAVRPLRGRPDAARQVLVQARFERNMLMAVVVDADGVVVVASDRTMEGRRLAAQEVLDAAARRKAFFAAAHALPYDIFSEGTRVWPVATPLYMSASPLLEEGYLVLGYDLESVLARHYAERTLPVTAVVLFAAALVCVTVGPLTSWALALRASNRQLASATRQLESANSELEAFVYSASHDLRAPLRAIEGYSHTIREDHPAQIDDDVATMLDRISSEATRMSTLIDSLLTLSRVSRTEVRRRSVDVSGRAREILDGLAEADSGHERPVDVHVESGIVVEGDPDLVDLALNNLLSNAWKFTGDTPVPRIDVTTSSVEGATVVEIGDNGTGFDMSQTSMLYAPFRRLHTQAEFPGTGIGLAIVDRVVQAHGGRLWAESSPGDGAVFRFTLDNGRADP